MPTTLSPTNTEDKKRSPIFIRIGKGVLNFWKLRQKTTPTVEPIPVVDPTPKASNPIHKEPVIEEAKPEPIFITNEEDYSAFFLFLCSDELKAASAAVVFVGTIAIALAVFSPAMLGTAATIALLTGTGMVAVSALAMTLSFGCGFFKKQPEIEMELENKSHNQNRL